MRLLILPLLLVAPAAHAEYASALIDGVPHVEQRPDFCGEACAEMWLKKLGEPIDQDQIFAETGVDPALGRGAVTNDLRRGLERLGFDVGPVWRSHRPNAASIETEWSALHADLQAGIPSIVCMHYSDAPKTTEHFRLILGYDADTDEVIYHEPAEPNAAHRRMKRALFQKLWTFKPAADRWTTIRFRLDRTRAPEPLREPERPRISEADYAQRVMKIKEMIGGEPFTIILERPFIVIGDGKPADVKKQAARVRWTMNLLRKDYFREDPREIIDVWVFKNERSYRRHAKAFFNDEPDTPYGYYSPAHQALVMNIGPGYGTLVHELVHPYIHTNFPNCPPWLNEGLASLYERPVERDGRLIGLVNWRLPGLKRAIRDRTVPSFERLTSMNEEQFYGDETGTNYATARYLVYTLQERGVLPQFVREFMAAQKTDPTGLATLKRMLDQHDLPAYELSWQAEMLQL